MSTSVDVPKVGPVQKKWLIGGGVAVGGYVLWRYWQASQAAAADTTATDQTDSTGSYGIDDGSGAGGYYDPNAGGIGGDSTVGTVISTDQQWYDAALLALEDAGYDTGAGALALGKYLRSEPLTPSEQDMVKVALAAAGNPPSGAKAIVTDTSGSAPSGLTAPTQLRSGGTPTTAAIPLTWNAVSGASGYVVYRGSTQLATVAGTSYTAGSLSAGTSYSFTVRATNTGGTLSPPSNTYTASTAKSASSSPPKTTTPPPKTSTTKTPAHDTVYITTKNRTLSAAISAYNKAHHTNHSVTDVWNFNLKYRKPSTVKTLKSRGPNKVYLGSSFWIPK